MPFPSKFTLFSAIFSCLLPGLFAQEAPAPIEGKIRYVIKHDWTKKLESLDYISKQRKERNAYMWGGSRSEWTQYAYLYINPNETLYEDSQESANDDDMGYSWRKNAYALRRNFAEGTMLDHIEILGKKYVVEDSIRCQDWKIMNDLKEVAGHVCMNASWEDTIKQLHVVVWFALDIPQSGGPERLCGLPGLILEADVNYGALVMTADKIEAHKLSTELDNPKKLKGKRITDAEYLDLIRKHIAEKRKNEEPWFWGIRYF